MLSVNDLKTFSAAHVATRANLENYIVVASDDELVKQYKDTVNSGQLCTLVVILPTHDSDIADEDNRKLRNNLFFMIIKKTDGKASPDERIDNFALAQAEIKAFLIKVLDLQSRETDCLFRDLDFASFRIDPVEDYVGANGFSIEFSNSTTF